VSKKKKVIAFLQIHNHPLVVYSDGDYWIDKGNKETLKILIPFATTDPIETCILT
jgi:hypothetical protein